MATPDPTTGRVPQGLGPVIPVDGDAGGLQTPVVEPVISPEFRDTVTDKIMLAAAGAGGNVYALFASDDVVRVRWMRVAVVTLKMGDYISAVASLRGNLIYVGTNLGRIFVVTTISGTTMELSVPVAQGPPAITGAVTRFVIVHDTPVFALYSARTFAFVIQQSGFSWPALGGGDSGVARGDGLPFKDSAEGRFFCMDVDRGASPPTLFVASDARVFMSRDLGDTWRFVPGGLPRRAHCADLRAVSHTDGSRYLYLSTFGRSLWRARLSPH